MRMTRAQSKEANKRALIDAAREVVGREGSRAKLEEIVERAGLTTGAVYSLFGGKNGLLVAMVTDYVGRFGPSLADAASPGLPLEAVVAEVARYFWRMANDPATVGQLLFEWRLVDLMLNDAELRTGLGDAVHASETPFAALFAGRVSGGSTLTLSQALRLARALKATMSGLGQSVILGVQDSSEEYFVDVALALVTPRVLGPA
ncbi:TetR/AcrR family transcriptional regulator [Streptosporangium sp. NPDC051023]|uniref:TetR/AcrR family transcriptional regulator n=1 Tax=Streptosporangium sp. NPDC051023 TaxID=3155410 RepID=UPI00344E1A37